MSHRIVFLDRDTIAPYIAVRRPEFEHEWTEYGRTRADQVVESGANHRGPVRGGAGSSHVGLTRIRVLCWCSLRGFGGVGAAAR